MSTCNKTKKKTISSNKLIVRQAKQIAELERELDRCKGALATINSIIYCCGGPLNDNALQYTRAQMSDFARIVSAIRSI